MISRSNLEYDEALAEKALVEFIHAEGNSDSFAELCVRSVRHFSDHPALIFDRDNDQDLATEMGHDFWAHRAAGLRTKILAQGADARHTVFIVRKTAENWLTDKWRTTTFGSVHHGLQQELSDDPSFVKTPTGHWALPSTRDGQWDGDEDKLLSAAKAIHAKVPPWESERRRSPLAKPVERKNVLIAIFESAEGPLPLATLTRVCIMRFPHVRDPIVVEFSETDALTTLVTDQGFAEVDDNVDRDSEISIVRAFINSLTEEQRFILRNRQKPEAIQQNLNLRPSQAAKRTQEVIVFVRNQVLQHPDREAIIFHLDVMLRGEVTE
jgi:hypothetical protein